MFQSPPCLYRVNDIIAQLTINTSTAWALDILYEKNYVYDSSIVPVKTQLYGFDNSQKSPYKITKSSLTKDDPNGKLLEFPLIIGKFFGKTLPVSGGFYLRTLPLNTAFTSIRNYEKQNIPATIFVHSWELTPEFMPKINLPFKENFITFHNIDKSYQKLENDLSKNRCEACPKRRASRPAPYRPRCR